MSSNASVQLECDGNTVIQPEISPGNAYIGLILAVLLILYTFVGIVWYAVLRRTSVHLQRRNFAFVLPMSVFSVFVYIWGFREYIGRDEFPCTMTRTIGPVIFAFVVIPHVLRAFLFFANVRYQNIIAKEAISNIIKQPDGRDLRQFQFDSVINFREGKKVDEYELKIVSQFKRLRRLKVFASLRFFLLIWLFAVGLVLGLTINTIMDVVGCKGCQVTVNNDGARIVYPPVAAIAVLLVAILWKIRNEPDPFGISKELRYSIIVAFTFASIWAIGNYADPGSWHDKGKFTWVYFMMLGFAISFWIVIYWQIFIARKHSTTGTDNNQVGFQALMDSSTGRQLFKRHLMNEFSIENYYFWREATTWKKNYNTLDKLDNEKRFRFIYESFIHPDALFQVNVSGSNVDAVTQVANGNEDLSDTVFDDCIRSCFMLMVMDSFPRFRKTSLYNQYTGGSNEILRTSDDSLDDI